MKTPPAPLRCFVSQINNLGILILLIRPENIELRSNTQPFQKIGISTRVGEIRFIYIYNII